MTADGAVKAFDCLPSLLTVPLLLARAFVYEPIGGGALRLLSALPREWYGKAFSAKRIGYSGGRLDITSDGETVTLAFAEPSSKAAELILRGCGEIDRACVIAGGEWIEEIRGNRILLRAGCRTLTVEL